MMKFGGSSWEDLVRKLKLGGSCQLKLIQFVSIVSLKYIFPCAFYYSWSGSYIVECRGYMFGNLVTDLSLASGQWPCYAVHVGKRLTVQNIAVYTVGKVCA